MSKLRWLARQWPVFAWAALICTFSTHWFSEAHTSRVIFPILRFFFPHASLIFLGRAHDVIRKCAHLFEYFVFSLLLLRAIRNGRPGWRITWALAAILIVFGFACLDEFHQSFVPGRDAEFSDALLDTSGAAFAQILAALWTVRKKADEQPRQA